MTPALVTYTVPTFQAEQRCGGPSPSSSTPSRSVAAQCTCHGPQVQGVVGIKPLVHGSSDRFALGAASVGLQLCRPFLAGEAKHMAFLRPDYLQTELHR